MDRYKRNFSWWQERAWAYPYSVESPVGISPLDAVNAKLGPFIRAVCEPNIARWGFKELETAHKFAEMFLERETPSPDDVYEYS